MKRNQLILRSLQLLLPLFLLGPVAAQDNGKATVLRIGDDRISRKEFKTVYFKNNKDSAVTEKALKDYMQLFIDFKLKVKEAERMGLDTTKKFKKEFERYKEQLAKPYLIDSTAKEKLLKEAYERTKTQTHASHILIKLDENALPKDTAKAYQRIMKVKERIQNSDSSFLQIGKKLKKKKADLRASDLGYFDAFRMVYPFENVAYNTKEGSIGGPVRTKYGYHLIKVHDKRPSQGRIKVAHIMKHAPRKASPSKKRRAEKKIKEIYQKVKNGTAVEKLARKYSDDKRTARRGGKLPWFSYGEMVPSFSKVAFSLDSNGAVSRPVRTRYGWHIIKRIDLKPLKSYEEMRPKLEKKLKKSDRFDKVKDAVVERLKKEKDLKVKERRLKRFISSMPDSGFVPEKWAEEHSKLAGKALFTFADTSVPVKALVHNIGPKGSLPSEKAGKRSIVNDALQKRIKKALLEHKKEHLAEDHPRYSALLQEYRDGILLFELMEKKVWQKALEDTSGLREFYEKHKEDYQWNERLDLTYFKCTSRKAAKRVRGMLKEGSTRRGIVKELRDKKAMKCNVDSGSFERKEYAFLDEISWEKGVSDIIKAKGDLVVGKVHKVIPPGPKKLKEARGLVSSDYQDHLEKRWVDKLRKKYTIEVNKEALRSIAEAEGKGQ